jgi:hypothetical protein
VVGSAIFLPFLDSRVSVLEGLHLSSVEVELVKYYDVGTGATIPTVAFHLEPVLIHFAVKFGLAPKIHVPSFSTDRWDFGAAQPVDHSRLVFRSL